MMTELQRHRSDHRIKIAKLRFLFWLKNMKYTNLKESKSLPHPS